MENDEKLTVGANSLYLPRHLTDYKVTVDISAEKIESSPDELSEMDITEAEMTVYNALKTGEKVHVLSFNKGKQYYVLDRA